jgi:starch-binding outer membrane protein, SusD/RagB family
MKITKLLIAGAACIMLASSCKKSYLDEPKPANGALDAGIIFGSKIGAENAITGVYDLLRYYASGQQNMYGNKSIQLMFEVMGNDIIADPGNWWLYEDAWSQNTYGRIATGARTTQIWNLFYKVINNTNAIIKNVPNIPEGQDTKDAFVAEARALRAYAYFNLARIYQFSYSKDANAKAVPIYTEPADASSQGNARATLKEVYDLITSDLEFAVTKLPVARLDKFRVNKNVAQGFLAQVYQEMAMSDNTLWTKAITNAQGARQGFSLMSAASYKSGFNDRTNSEWIWAQPFNSAQQQSYASFFGYIDHSGTRYKCLYINSSFVSLFSTTDARNLFAPASGQSAANPWKRWITTKFKDKADLSGDFVMMRAAEMYLIEAEALAQTNQLEEAKDVLFALQSARDASAARSGATTKDELINEILIERRKELYGEIGVQFFDLKRYQLPLVTDGNSYAVLNIPADDKKWVFQIPQSEIDANPNIEPADQNP